MKLMSGLIATSGAAAGLVLGNYLYEADKKANEQNEVPVPFYTVRKAAEDIGKEAEKIYNNFKERVSKKPEDVDEEVAAETTEESTIVTEEETVVVEEAPEEIKVATVTDDDPVIPKFTVVKEETVEATKSTESKKKTTTSKKKEDVDTK